jgi:succinoglycan biosynthesis transport protein ExoP
MTRRKGVTRTEGHWLPCAHCDTKSPVGGSSRRDQGSSVTADPGTNRPAVPSNGSAGAPATQQGTSTVVDVWALLRKYWPTALATMLAVLLGSIFFTLGQTKIYEAKSKVLFDPHPARPLGSQVEAVGDVGADNPSENREHYATQCDIIRSESVALAVVKDLGLHNDLGFLQNLPPGATPAPADKTQPEDAAELLQKRLEVTLGRGSRLATVTIQDADAQRAQRVLAAVLDTYMAQNVEAALDSTTDASDWLRTQLDGLKVELESSEMDLNAYKQDKGILAVGFDDQSSLLRERMRNIDAELTRAEALLQDAAARAAVLSSVPEDDPSQMISSDQPSSALLAPLRQQYESAKVRRDALLGSGKGANHPEVAAASREVEATKAAVQKELHAIKVAQSRDVAVLQRRIGGLSGMLSQAGQKAHDLNLLEIEYNRLKRNMLNTEKLYSIVLERTKESDLQRVMRVSNVRVVDRPLLPRRPVSPRVPLNIALGAVAGMMLGAAAAFARGRLDRTLKVPEDVEQELGLTFLGLLPEVAAGIARPAYGRRRRRQRAPSELPAAGGGPALIVHDQPGSAIAEAARAIRTNLLFMAPDQPHATLLVTSPGPGEGKTTVACWIGIAMAQAGQRVVIVDCDLRRPQIHRIFKKSADVGVTTALIDERYDAVIQETDVPNLSVIPSGPIPPNPAELFHNERFKRLLEALAKRFDRVIIDSPPVTVVTDGTVLSTLVDSTILVARAFSTRKDLARQAMSSIHAVGGKIAGAVLNAVDFTRLGYRYYYYYGRDGYYRTQSPEHAAAPTADEQPQADTGPVH